jgi:cyclopropane fatty-acyl-phospholipid synthase-like methyltransferase
MNTAFDIASLDYDKVFTFSTIGKAQRRRVFKYLSTNLFDRKTSILELNCGTGDDAIRLSKMGHQVFATDSSQGMIQIAKTKQFEPNCHFETLDITTLSEDVFETDFDLIFSNFGGFNCLKQKDIQTFFETSSSILSENGRIVLVIMPKNTLWEQIYFSLKGQFKKAKRRNTTASLDVNVAGENVKTWYYNPNDIVSLASNFKLEKIKPIGLWIPPSYLESSIFGKKISIRFLSFLEQCFSFSFFSKYADHYYIEFKKVS